MRPQFPGGPLAISPNAPLLDQLEPLLAAHLGDADLPSSASLSISTRSCPIFCPRGSAASGVSGHRQDRDQALQLLDEMGRMGPHVQVIALLASNEPDFILRCLRAGASDFLILP